MKADDLTLRCLNSLKLVCVGLSFIRENMWRLIEEEEDWMLVGFEFTCPSLLEMAKDLDLDLPYDDPGLQEIYGKRDLKLSK